MDEVVRQGLVSADMWRAWHRLSAWQREVLSRRLRGERSSAIARAKGVSRQAIDDAAGRALKQLGLASTVHARQVLDQAGRRECRRGEGDGLRDTGKRNRGTYAGAVQSRVSRLADAWLRGEAVDLEEAARWGQRAAKEACH